MSQPGWRGKLQPWHLPGWRSELPRGHPEPGHPEPGHPEPGHPERGSLTLMLVVMFVALIALAGLVVDGGAKVTAAEDATSAAQEAARAGAGMVDRANAYANGSIIVDQRQAIAEANQFLANAGYTGQAVPGPAGENSIKVTVTVVKPTKVLSIIGIDRIQVTGTATATLVSGVTGPGQ
jgi:Flp pilus assembly protein TadG